MLEHLQTDSGSIVFLFFNTAITSITCPRGNPMSQVNINPMI